MKRLLFVCLAIMPILILGQSDLAIESSFAGNENGINNRKDKVAWSLKIKNIGISNANISNYQVIISEDQTIDPSDTIIRDGLVGDYWTPTGGLVVNDSIVISSSGLPETKFRFPELLDANKQYYIIFHVDLDTGGGEVNDSNNTVIHAFYLALDNQLQIINVDPLVPLGNKTPLLLVHGWQPLGTPAEGNIGIWDNFLVYFNANTDLIENYKPYYVKYYSNVVPVIDLGHELRLDLDNWFDTEYTGNITIVAHSMGGLVSRAFAKRIRVGGPHAGDAGGERVNKLITLGTPHHGSYMANGDIRINPLYVPYSVTPTILTLSQTLDYLLYFTTFLPASTEYNRWDTRWDNFDNFYDYPPDSNDSNIWLNSIYMNGDPNDYFDDKIIAYAGGIFEIRSPTTISNSLFSQAYELGEVFLANLTTNGYNHSDGIVPFNSAKFEGHQINKYRTMYNYYHDEMAKGRFDYIQNTGTDNNLFGLIKADLLGAQVNARIEVEFDNNLFPETALTQVSTKEITISNPGDSDLIVTSVQIVGADSANFTVDITGTEIESNGEATISVNFSPVSIGTKMIDIVINNNSVNEPVKTISFLGEAVETAIVSYDINADPEYNFGDVYIYGGVNTITLNVENKGSAPYTIDDLVIGGVDADDFSIVSQPTSSLFNPGDFDIIILSFNPETIGTKTAVITASFEGSTNTDSAILIGNGIYEYIDPNTPNLVSYEYWFNNDYVNKQSVILSGQNSVETISFTADAINQENGLNKIHFRIKDKNGVWSSILSKFFYKTNSSGLGSNKMVEYRFWFNQDFSTVISGMITPIESYLFLEDINVNGLSDNSVNYIHFQFRDIYGNWSSVLTEEFLFETLSINEEDTEKLKLYPNPTNSIVYVTTQIIDGELSIYDNLGKLIKAYKTVPSEIDISEFESGLYFIEINDVGLTIKKKVIKY